MTLTASRNRHDPMEDHTGDLPAELVELGSALGVDLPEGMALDQALLVVHLRLLRLEDADVFVGTFKGDAWVADLSFTADAVIFATIGGSFSGDAIKQKTSSGLLYGDAITLREQTGFFYGDAWIQDGTVFGSFYGDAVLEREQMGSFDADAVIKGEQTGSFTGDARIMPFFTGDAWIVAVESEESSTLGEMTLGDGTLGG